MNQDKINIDELLKQSFDDFAPDAPDVWHGIEQGISQATVTASSVTVQAHSWVVKMVVTAFTATVFSTVAFLAIKTDPYNQSVSINNSATKDGAIQTQANETIAPSAETNLDAYHGASQSTDKLPTLSGNKLSTENKREQKLQTSNNSKESSIQLEDIVPSTSMLQVGESTIKQEIQSNKTSAKQEPKVHNNITHPRKEIVEENNDVQTHQQETNDLENISIPNVFTPNGDGLNDYFVIELPPCEEYFIKILNRKGQIVFETDKQTENWNGRVKNSGENCEPGVYVYVLKYNIIGRSVVTKNGKINLIN
jgi:gliding motility-associated-like protein